MSLFQTSDKNGKEGKVAFSSNLPFGTNIGALIDLNNSFLPGPGSPGWLFRPVGAMILICWFLVSGFSY